MNDRIIQHFEALVGRNAMDCEGILPIVSSDSEEQTAQVLAKAAAEQVPVTVRGGGMLPVPEADECGIVLSTAGLANPPVVRSDDLIVETGAGVTLSELSAACEKEGFALPLDLRFGRNATIGGAFMSGTYGVSAYLADELRGQVIGCRAVTANGDVITGGGKTVKNVTGYDIPRFLAGSMGLFAVVTSLTIKLNARFPATSFVTASGTSLSAVATAVGDVMSEHVPTYVEISRSADTGIGLFASFAGVGESVADTAVSVTEKLTARGLDDVRAANGGINGFTVLADEAGRFIDWYAFVVPPAAVQSLLTYIDTIGSDCDILARPIHGVVLVRAANESSMIDELSARSLALGGKRPVSHGRVIADGIGHLFSPEEYAVLERLKRNLDPSSILNPALIRG